MMRQDTAIVICKGLCYVFIGGLTPLTVSLAQWVNSGDSPSMMAWIVVIASCGVGAATQLLSYLSGSYSDYVKGRINGSSNPSDTTQMMLSKFGTGTTTTQTHDKSPN